MSSMRTSTLGLSLVELLVVISIIGILATVTAASFGDSRETAKRAAAEQELVQMYRGVQGLILDVVKAPNGCPYDGVANPEVQLNVPTAGLLSVPPVGFVDIDCEWTTFDIGRWDGPYAESATDPWGNSYWYDPDYQPYLKCPELAAPTVPVIQAVVSRGADDAWYTCDDVYLELK